MRKLAAAIGMIVSALLVLATPALACGGLVAPNGTVRLLRTTTLAAWHDGVEHYVTSFQFAGDSTAGEFGSIVPLPAVPTSVERGGDWTLQRLEKETTPPPPSFSGAVKASATAGDSAVVLQQVRVDALDITVLKGGGKAVGDWAREHGFLLTPDAPEVLDFYAARSPIFLAARFDAAAARARGQQAGDGTPVHITMPLPNPWVPLRILALGRGPLEPVQADIYLLTDSRPTVLPAPDAGMRLDYSSAASDRLLTDLRSDKGMSWVPQSAWLSLFRINTASENLRHDLAVDVTGKGRPSVDLAGISSGSSKPATVPRDHRPGFPSHSTPWPAIFAITAVVLLGGALAVAALRAGGRQAPVR